jgi:octaprenyl-diphosphate synthase
LTGRPHAPLLGASERADEEERAFWRRTIEDQDKRAGSDLERAIRLVERRALAETLSRAPSYAATAIGALSRFCDGIKQRALIDDDAFATERSF